MPTGGPLAHVVGYLLAYGFLFGTIMMRGDALRAHPRGAYLMLVINLVPTAALVRWLTRSVRPAGEALAAIATKTSGLIGFFALIYGQIGLVGQTAPVPIATGLYFSIVTWTTLGYGDLQPVESLRILAASEALIGYLYLSLLVAVLAKALKL